MPTDPAASGKRLAVIGAGPGGYPAAFHAALRGLDVTLIDTEENPGGVCTYRSCIPSKALLHAARVIGETREAQEFGIEFGQAFVSRHVEHHRNEDTPQEVDNAARELIW